MNGETGFTFLVVIWALSVVIVLSLVFAASTSTQFKIARNAIDNARAEALADAGVQLAVLDLLAVRAKTLPQPRFPRDGRLTRCSPGGGDQLGITVEDEVGKVDLNTADERLIRAALIASGVVEDDAAVFAARIADYRDPDGDRRRSGAEIEEYRAQDRPAGPKNRPFDTIEEVEQVLGVPAGLAEALRPYATIYSGQPAIDGNLASRRLIAALSSDRMESEFENLPSTGLAQSRAGSASMLAFGVGGRAFRVLSEARLRQGAVFVREAILEFVPGQPNGYIFRRWRRGTAVDADRRRSPGDDVPPC